MSTPHTPTATPPTIPGFEYRRVLGVGGFSTVFLYEQMRPRREVAIKVLATDMLNAESQRRFEIEANLMAELSAHPYIVTIYDADFTDDGRPYLVMEYYPGPNLGVRARTERIGVAEVLQMGIQIASAVETAHRAGIVHRDIKPANILTSRYHRPGLTDFGISVSAEVGEHGEGGMSVPWSPPETFDTEAILDNRSDIYSLGALVYNLLTGRSPFEIPDQVNDAASLEARILTGTPTPIGREDVPPELERALLQAMAKRPDLRPASALALARAFQAVEQDLSLPPSQIDILDTVSAASATVVAVDALAAEPTRLRGSTIDSRSNPGGTPAAAQSPSAQSAEATVMRTTPPPNTALCPSCGIAIAEGARFCGACGIDITASRASTVAGVAQTTAAADTSAAPTVAIRSATASGTSTPAAAGTASADARKRAIIIGAAIALVVFIGIGIVVAVVGGSGSAPATPAPAVSSAPSAAVVKPTARPTTAAKKPAPTTKPKVVPRPARRPTTKPKPKPSVKPAPKAPVDPADVAPKI